jgi:REP element-mobilizing transposase RayT
MHHPTRQHRHLAHVPSFRDNPIVFVTTGTHQRKQLLANAQCHEILREIWEKSMKVDGWCVGHYILMPDHVHLFARLAIDARPMADWIKMWKSISSRKIAAVLATSPPIWQADYSDRYLRSSENYSQKWHYVEQNAVRAGLVSDPEDWPYRGIVHDLMY